MAAEEQPASTLSIGRAEFQRLQTQLIELRTTNYQLKEQQAKLSSEITQFQSTVQSQGRELEKAHKTIQKSKKAKEFQVLVEENDSIQRKIQTQEEDFRLQNKTLMEELSKVCDENEALKSQLQSGSSAGGEGGGGGSEELTHLRAENVALQKSLQALQEKLQERSGEGEAQHSDSDLSSSNGKVLDLEVKLATEAEEKKILRQKLEEIQESARREQAQLQSELEKWTDKAKKKQDSLLQLQEEKEKHFQESRAAFNEMVRSKDHEIQTLHDQIQSLKDSLATRREETTTSEEIAKQLETLSTAKEELNLKCSTLTQDKESLVKERDETKLLLEELGRELHQSKAELGEQRQECTNLRTELEEAKLSQEQLADQVVRTSEERFNIIKELEAAQKLAEKRKSLLDEMAIKGQESVSEQLKKMEAVQDNHKELIHRLERELEEEQGRARRLLESSEEIPELKRRLKVMEEEKHSLETGMAELKETLSQQQEAHQSTVVKLKQEYEEQSKSLQSEVEASRLELESNRKRLQELELTVEDKEEAVKIVEKKSNSMLKDLKRQLQQMQKREERLQEQIAEIRGGQVLEQMFTSPAPPPNRELSHDSNSRHSRESSLSSVKGAGALMDGASSTTAGAVGTSPTSSMGPSGGSQLIISPIPQGQLSEETQELLSRIADLQQEKWLLETKVNHLENTGSALAEDVLQKSEIIKTYFMEAKADHTPPPKLSVVDKMSPLRLLHKGREETLSEINRKMQRALEEALTKNIHLQDNMETLTTELEKYTKVEESTKEEGSSDSPELSHGTSQSDCTQKAE